MAEDSESQISSDVKFFLGIAGTPTTDACDYVKQLANSQVTVEVVQVTGQVLGDPQVNIFDGNNRDVGDAVKTLMPGTYIAVSLLPGPDHITIYHRVMLICSLEAKTLAIR